MQTGPMHDGHADDYLAWIGARKPDRPDAAALAELTRRHLATVPFENLSIHLGEPIALDEDAFLDKLVTRRRGGFLRELNGRSAPAGAARVRRHVARRAGVRARRRWDRRTTISRCGWTSRRTGKATQGRRSRGWSTSGSVRFVAEPLRLDERDDQTARSAPSGWSRPATATSTSCWTGPRSTAWTCGRGARRVRGDLLVPADPPDVALRLVPGVLAAHGRRAGPLSERLLVTTAGGERTEVMLASTPRCWPATASASASRWTGCRR